MRRPAPPSPRPTSRLWLKKRSRSRPDAVRFVFPTTSGTQGKPVHESLRCCQVCGEFLVEHMSDFVCRVETTASGASDQGDGPEEAFAVGSFPVHVHEMDGSHGADLLAEIAVFKASLRGREMPFQTFVPESNLVVWAGGAAGKTPTTFLHVNDEASMLLGRIHELVLAPEGDPRGLLC